MCLRLKVLRKDEVLVHPVAEEVGDAQHRHYWVGGYELQDRNIDDLLEAAGSIRLAAS